MKNFILFFTEKPRWTLGILGAINCFLGSFYLACDKHCGAGANILVILMCIYFALAARECDL